MTHDLWTAVDRYIVVAGFVELVAREPRLAATALQTVGVKGYDGLLLARVTA